MFESKEELRVTHLFEKRFPTIAKEMIATAVQTGCVICQNVMSDSSAMGIPKSKMFTQACSLGFIINTVLTKAIDDSNMPTMTYEETTVGHGRPVVHYLVDGFRLHIKKNRNAHTLPKRSQFRIEETSANRQLSLGFEEAVQKPMNLIVTFNQKSFRLRYVQIGIADYDYRGWLHRWDLMNYIQPERVEVMRNEYGPAIRENFEHIAKTYRLEMRN